MKRSATLRAADYILGLSYILVLSAALLCLGGCSQIGVEGITCSLHDFEFSCGIDTASSQDLRANRLVALDEKPDRPFAQPLQRFEEDAP